jgi:multiple sugar transport system permease protein
MTEATVTPQERDGFFLSRWLGSKKFRTNAVKIVAYVLVTAGAIVLLIPFFWMLSTSVKPLSQAFAHPPIWIPNPPQWQNFGDAWNALPFSRFFLNSLFVTTFGMAAEILSCAVVAYGFARFRFPGRNVLFIILLATMMLPWVVKLIPGFIIWRNLKLVNTFDPLVVGALFAWGPVNVFIIRQFMMGIPMEIEEAARIDGANVFEIFTRIMLPLVRPALLAVAVLTFGGFWNNFLGPLIYLNDMDKYTLTLGMFFFLGGPNEPPKWHWLMAMSTIMIIPVLAVFFMGQRYFIEGITLTGLKG